MTGYESDMNTHPRCLRDDARFSVFGKRCAPIVHDTAIVIFSPKRVNSPSVILPAIVLVS